MKHDFSIQDIVGALKKARGIQNHYSDAQLAHLVDQARDINEVLHHLPDPAPVADEWEECRVRDLQKGDRYMVTGEDWKIEGVVAHPGALTVCYDPVRGLSIGEIALYEVPSLKLYRIPKPVEHPEPEFHPVIYVPVREEGWVWDGEVYVCDSHGGHRGPGDFTDWEPAKIVPKNFVGDYPRRKLEYKGLPTAGDDRG